MGSNSAPYICDFVVLKLSYNTISIYNLRVAVIRHILEKFSKKPGGYHLN